MTNFWIEGDNIFLRGVYNNRPTYVQSVRVIKDTPEETALYIWPGAECAAPHGYIHHGHTAEWNRWKETLGNTLNIEKYFWRTNRFLILLEPEKFFSTIHIWNAASNNFVCYYINFQLPFTRTNHGFNTLDLDLDILIKHSLEWEWKDEKDFQEGIRAGGIRAEWVEKIDQAKKEVFARLESREYPFNAAWLNWQPDPNWPTPKLPKDWDKI